MSATRNLLPIRSLRRVSILVVFACAVSLHGQVPSAPFPASPANRTLLSDPHSSFQAGPFGFTSTGAGSGEVGLRTSLWGRSLHQSFEFGAHPSGSGMSLNQSGPFLRRSSNLFEGAAPRQLAPLFPQAASARDGMFGAHTTSPEAFRIFDPLAHGAPNLRFNSSLGMFKLSYRESFGLRGFSTDRGTDTSGAPNSGSGMFNLSAGSGFGSRSTSGASGNGFGGAAGTPKHSGPSVAVRLTF